MLNFWGVSVQVVFDYAHVNTPAMANKFLTIPSIYDHAPIRVRILKKSYKNSTYCWWFRNPANQLRLVVYPIIYRV